MKISTPWKLPTIRYVIRPLACIFFMCTPLSVSLTTVLIMNCYMQVEELKALDDTLGKVIMSLNFVGNNHWSWQWLFCRWIYRRQAQNTRNCGTKFRWIWGICFAPLGNMNAPQLFISPSPPLPDPTSLLTTAQTLCLLQDSLCCSQAHHSRGYSQHSATTGLSKCYWKHFI